MDWKSCTVCGHEFDPREERQLITCEHAAMLCPCGIYGYACMHHQAEADEASGRREPLWMSVTHLPDDWELVTVHAGLTVLVAAMRHPVPAGLMGSDEEFGL